MSRLEQLILSMVDLFEEYAGQDGEVNTISMEELKQLIEKEVSKPELKEKIHADDISRAMDFLDKNHDGDVNFNEFSRCVATLARGYYKSGKGGKGHKKNKTEKRTNEEHS
ncbi:Protein S100-A6 [Merluccius polli]|uniref:Protein S100-A6 n=1 Tax=Merluccius polli TaxID=89951 RepID=A0AA47MSL1_MERPO|nr:Protein S100-A6 [Merluccius polli]